MLKKLLNFKKLFFVLTLSFYIIPVQAIVNQDAQLWLQFVAQGAITDKVLGFFEIQPRIDEDISELHTVLIRTALGYPINDNLSVWQGYAWTPILNPQFRNEQRPYQQLLINYLLKNITLINRTRLEERFLQGASGMSLRIRHLISVSIPLPRTTNWFTVLSDEIFFNLNSVENGPPSGFNQNRLYLGLGHQLNSSMSVQGGYMMNYVNASIVSHRLNHVMLLNWTLNFS